MGRESTSAAFVIDKPNIGKPCTNCGMPVTPRRYGDVWGRNEHRHRDRDVCIGALGDAMGGLWDALSRTSEVGELSALHERTKHLPLDLEDPGT